MRAMNMMNLKLNTRLLLTPAAALLVAATAYSAAPGITGPTFNLTAQAAYVDQPDGAAIYQWGYGCNGAPSGFAPATIANAFCPTMQVPGPTMIVTEGATVTVNLTNNLPTPAGNTSIVFSGFQVAATGGVPGLLTQEAAPGGLVTYTFTASTPGTHTYYSGTQSDLQVEMGLYGVVIVIPATIPTACTTGEHAANLQAEAAHGEADYRLAAAAFDHPKSCYDREYLFQFAEMDPRIHQQADDQVRALGNCTAGAPGCSLDVATEPYHPAYFVVNGRSMPDVMDPNYETSHPHQPYNADPHMHAGEQVLVRVVGEGRWQHPFHEHANHVRILGRDGNIILSQTDPANNLAGPVLFTTSTVPGQTADGIFYFTGRGLNWDMYGHNPNSTDPLAKLPCVPDANGYYTADPTAVNYYEWCQDHNKPLEVAPFGDVAGGGPATLPDPNILTNGFWYGGSPYLGPDATIRAVGPTGTTPPSGTVVNPPSSEAAFAYMWHSHNEREITTNNIFPGGMLLMMLVDSREFVIDETN